MLPRCFIIILASCASQVLQALLIAWSEDLVSLDTWFKVTSNALAVFFLHPWSFIEIQHQLLTKLTCKIVAGCIVLIELSAFAVLLPFGASVDV